MMDSRATDTQFLDSMDKPFGLFPLTGLSKSEKFEFLFQHQMPTLNAWAMVSTLLILVLGFVGSFVFCVVTKELGGLGIFVVAIFVGLMFRVVFFILVWILPIIFFRTLLANRGLFFYWLITFGVHLSCCAGIHFYITKMVSYDIRGVVIVYLWFIAFRFLSFVVLTVLYFLYRPKLDKKSDKRNLDSLNLDEHLTN